MSPSNAPLKITYHIYIFSVLLIQIFVNFAMIFDIFIMRQLVFFFISLVPGMLLLDIFKINNICLEKRCVLSVGLSISILMLLGSLVNYICLSIGSMKPLSFINLVIAFNLATWILCLLAYYRNKDDTRHITILPENTQKLFSKSLLFLISIPVLSIFGAELINATGDTLFLMILIIIISITMLISTLNRIPTYLFPLVIIVIGISLLFHSTLISYYLRGGDIHSEYALCNSIKDNQFWNYNDPGTLNSMLSVTILPQIYHYLLNIDYIWIYKIIYPLLFSLVPLGMYLAYESQIGKLRALLSASLFMSFVIFFTEMTSLPRQQIAELYFALLILLIVDKDIEDKYRKLLFIIFSFSMIVSHYGLSYIFMILLSFTISLRCLIMRFSIHRNNNIYNLEQNSVLTTNMALLFITFSIIWFETTANSSVFNMGVYLGDHMFGSIKDLFAPAATDPYISMAFGKHAGLSMPYIISIIIFNIVQFLIISGLLISIKHFNKLNFNRYYLLLSSICLVILTICIVLPKFAASLNITRIYHIILFFLAPFYVIGGEALLRWPFNTITKLSANLYLTSTLLIVFFLFQTGFIFEIIDDTPLSYSLSYDEFAYQFTYKQDIIGFEWLLLKSDILKPIYSDIGRVLFYIPNIETDIIIKPLSLLDDLTINNDNYIYLRFGTRISNKVMPDVFTLRSTIQPVNFTSFGYVNKIYENGGSEVFLC